VGLPQVGQGISSSEVFLLRSAVLAVFPVAIHCLLENVSRDLRVYQIGRVSNLGSRPSSVDRNAGLQARSFSPAQKNRPEGLRYRLTGRASNLMLKSILRVDR
jgi:hypothetical protein